MLTSIKEIETLANSAVEGNKLYSKLLFLINSPAQRLATIGVYGCDLAIVVKPGARKENKFKGGEAAAQASGEAAPGGEEAAAAQYSFGDPRHNQKQVV